MIFEGLLVFLVVTFFSYTSNIPPGFVNVKVIETSLFRGYRNGVKVALGAAIAELSYCAAAILTALFLRQFPILFYGINVLVAIVLIILAYKYFTGKSYAEQIEAAQIEFKDDNKKRNYHLFGAGVGFLNPQMFPFWFIFYTGMFMPSFTIDYRSSYYIFVIGAICGGFGLLWTYAFFAAKYRRKIFDMFRRYDINKYVGWMFLVMAVIKIVDLVVKFPWK